MKPLHAKRSLVIGCLAPVLVAYAPIAFAQAGDCTAEVKVTSIGVPVDDTTMRYRATTVYRYRIDATSSEKQCAVVNFNLRRSYPLPDGSPYTAAESGTIRIRGGRASDVGELPEKMGLPRIRWSVEDVSCRRC